MSVAPSTSLEGILYFTEEAQESNSGKKPHSLMGVPCILRPMVETLSISHATRHVNSGRQSPVDAQLQCYQGSSLAAVAAGWEPHHHGKKLLSQYHYGISKKLRTILVLRWGPGGDEDKTRQCHLTLYKVLNFQPKFYAFNGRTSIINFNSIKGFEMKPRFSNCSFE